MNSRKIEKYLGKFKYYGIWPVAPTPFLENGSVDYDGMERVIECILDQKVDGVCILANFSEQFLLNDEERKKLTNLCLKKKLSITYIICPNSLRLNHIF